MRVSELLRVCTWPNQIFDVRNGSIENDKSVWEYNLSHTDVLDMFGNRNVRQVFSDTTQEHDSIMSDFNNEFSEELQLEELTTISIVLEDEFKIGDRVIVNRNCEQRAWWYATGTVKRVTDETILIELDEEIYDGHIGNIKELILYKWKVDFLNEEEEQLYQVIINGDYLIKLFDNRNDHKFVGKEDLVIWLPSGYQLTEAEIKAIDERYWPFAVPVEKVEV